MSEDVDRLITDEVVEAGMNAPARWGAEETFREELRAALPLIIPVVRAEAEAAERARTSEQYVGVCLATLEGHQFIQYRDGRPPRCKCGAERLSIPYATKEHPRAVSDA